MQIDPLEAIIKWLTTALTIVSGRVAGKHRYGTGWTESQTGVSVHLDGGGFDQYGDIATPRIEVRIYATDQEAMVDIYRELVGLCRDNARFVVTTSNGNALVHFVKLQSGLSMLYNEEVRMDTGLVFLESWVSELAIV